MSTSTKPEKADVAAIFIDTNTFYEFNNLDQIKWLEVVNAKRIIIVLAQVIFRELNDHKDGGHKPHLAERAAGVIKNIDRFFDAAPDDAEYVPIMDGVDLHGQQYDAEVLPPYNPRMGDDQLVANVLRYQAENPHYDLYLLTEDRGLKLKCRGKGIRFLTLPDKYRTPKSLDPRDKKIKLLEKTLEAMQSQVPKLEVTFADETTEVEVDERHWLEDYEVSELLRSKWVEYPPQTAEFEFTVSNIGSCLAESIIVNIYLPQNCKLYERETSFSLPAANVPRSWNIYELSEDNSIQIKGQKLNHGFSRTKGPVEITFLDEGEHTVELQWEAHAANLPEPIEGILKVHIKKGH